MKYFIIQTEVQRQTNNFKVVKVRDTDESEFLEGLEEGTEVLTVGDSLMEVLITFEKTMARQL
ncbi:hypothetical protein QEG73_22785 [Chitinophagaceae bacterium 26-R-25]|nr:hypothetical protein [Chitinophagaceae bacterium 26-R-25]